MKLQIIVGGKSFISKANENEPGIMAEKIFESFSSGTGPFTAELEDGSFIVLPKEMVHRTVIIVHP